MLLQREALLRRVADAELELRLRLDAAIRQIAARLGARARRERRLEELRRKLDHVMQRLAPFLARFGFRRRFGSGMPAIEASRSTASGKFTPSVCITKSKMLPFLPDEKSNHAAFWSFTKNDGVFSLLNGDSPFHSRPAFLSWTRRPTTSETGRRDFKSSRNRSGKRMGDLGALSQSYPISRRDARAVGKPRLVPAIHRHANNTELAAVRTQFLTARFGLREESHAQFRILPPSWLLLATSAAFAQPRQDLVGSWTLVSSVVQQGSNRSSRSAPIRKAALIFDADGRYAAMIARAGLPKFAGDNRAPAAEARRNASASSHVARSHD